MWISVQEALPEDQQIVLAHNGQIFPIAVRYRVDKYYGGFRHGSQPLGNVTHWMYLPKLPAEAIPLTEDRPQPQAAEVRPVLDAETVNAKLTRLQAEVERLREQMRWIPVEERMPEKSYNYLVAIHGQPDAEEATFFADDKSWLSVAGYGSASEQQTLWPTHWMSLPASPSSVKETKK